MSPLVELSPPSTGSNGHRVLLVPKANLLQHSTGWWSVMLSGTCSSLARAITCCRGVNWYLTPVVGRIVYTTPIRTFPNNPPANQTARRGATVATIIISTPASEIALDSKLTPSTASFNPISKSLFSGFSLILFLILYRRQTHITGHHGIPNATRHKAHRYCRL